MQINWNNSGGFYHLPCEVQKEVFEKLGRTRYIKLPVEGTNPRGVEMSAEGLVRLVEHKGSFKIPIDCNKEIINIAA